MKYGHDFANMYPNFDTEVVETYGEFLAEVFSGSIVLPVCYLSLTISNSDNNSMHDITGTPKSKGTKRDKGDGKGKGNNNDKGQEDNDSNDNDMSAGIKPKQGEDGGGMEVDNMAKNAADMGVVVGGGSISLVSSYSVPHIQMQ